MGYVFDPNVLHQMALEAIAQHASPRERATTLVTALHSRYPRHIYIQPRWVMNNAGGATGAMAILHASITEYVIIFGTPIGTEGHTGRFFTDDYFDSFQLAFPRNGYDVT